MSKVLEHVSFSFEVELASDCHIGDGGERPITQMRPAHVELRKPENGEPEVRVATIVRDQAGLPFLPPTALKGALRKCLEASLEKGEVERLFGAIKSGDDGSMGRFTFYPAASREKLTRDADELPYWDTEERTWIATHVAISRETGAAEHMKLFNVEMIPAGTQFMVEGCWFGELEEAKAELPQLLAPLASREGLTVGSGYKLGLGALRFTASKNQVVLRQTRYVPETGDVERNVARGTLSIDRRKEVSVRVDMKLSCPGPFISVDPSRKVGHNDKKPNDITALKRNSQTPVLHMHTLAGALRARAAWLSACEGLGGDDRFKKTGEWANPAQLTIVERLFGVGGWRGLLRLSQPERVAANGSARLTSIAIDRFSGAVLDSTLFTHDVFTGVEFEVSVMLETRKGPDGTDYPSAEDKQFFETLMTDLQRDTLMLGHATNRGFGWFGVAVSGLEQFKETV